MAEFVYTMYKLRKVVPPDRVILDDVTLAFLPGAKIGVLGHNGAGKSTLLRIMAGLDDHFNGEAHPSPGVRVGHLAQEPELDPTKTVLGNVEEGVIEIRNLVKRFEELCDKLGEGLDDDEMTKVLDEQSTLQDKIDAANAWELDRTLETAMDALRCPPPDADVTKISGGERRRVALARLLLQKPDLLLLDEPTNHLDAESVAWLEKFLQDYPGTVVAITHDRYFLDNVAGSILELDRGRGIPWKGNYSSWLDQKQQRLKVEQKQESARQRTLERELEWIRMSPRARQAKSKARIKAFDELLQQSNERTPDKMEISIPPGPRLGDLVIETAGLTKSFGDRVLIDDFTCSIPRGAIVGIIGPNGAGKTTLFKMLVGQEKPDGGTLKIGETVKIAYVDQNRSNLDPTKSVWEELSGGHEEMEVGKRKMSSRAYVSGFAFRGANQQKLVGKLSGGERNRLHLAKVVLDGGNVLLLDEPSNDLDVDVLRALEDAILAFAGCVLVVSHDRWFLDRIATHIMAFEGEGKVTLMEGNFHDYEEDRKKRLGADALNPHRMKYKKLAT